MQIQCLTGRYFDDFYNYSDAFKAIATLGHEARLISYTTAIDENNPRSLVQALSKDADITLIDQAPASEIFTKLSIDEALVPNLISIWSPMLPLDTYCYPKPIILLNESEKYITDLITAVNTLNNSPKRHLDRTGHYKRTEYGWLLRNAEEELYALGMWEKLRDCFNSKDKFYTWTNDPSIPIIECQLRSSCGYITIKSTVDECIKIEMKDFCEIAKCWIEYKKGLIPNAFLHRKTHLFPYILGLLKYVNS